MSMWCGAIARPLTRKDLRPVLLYTLLAYLVLMVVMVSVYTGLFNKRLPLYAKETATESALSVEVIRGITLTKTLNDHSGVKHRPLELNKTIGWKSFTQLESNSTLKSGDITTKTSNVGTPVLKPTEPPVNQTLLAIQFKASIKRYLIKHHKMCLADWKKVLIRALNPLCNCTPPTLIGFRNISFDPMPLNRTFVDNPDVKAGGHWEPGNCTPRYRTAIIIPFRDRHYHLSVLLRYLHPILRGQMLNYTIFVVEQNKPMTFNKAAVMNIGFKMAIQQLNPDCVVFHDVDFIPQDGRHFYTCRENPLHLGAYHDRHKYRITYRVFGGVTSFRPATFEKINGFSNRFFGWGGEDDEMSYRIQENHFHVLRDPRPVGGYSVITHRRDKGNRQTHRRSMLHNLWHRNSTGDGLNSLKYEVKQIQYLPLYTHVLANVLNKRQ